ncbi:unnamed protein product [Rotaria socialis]|uniref:Peroxide-inducible transcript 1 protein n=1 Tax=Rotaria socialis TaxID=392032 RepID=A0A820VKB8_9BILA|nr:unnamed protein product [Rotaria socialis]CAF3369508.1 unnamed protein product [Rotaria socialis]CAF3401397.1 unnamed protein product [Rotaria socialis]CAF3738580.1 unnamed protein product [Rotaria socialis]CAF4312575.1 unnamed protein product [Rotaria socialis]
MDQYKKIEARKHTVNSNKLSSSVSDIDQLCNLIDQTAFGFKTLSSSKFHSVPSYQVKAFRSSRLKRLHSSSKPKSNITRNGNLSLFRSMHLSISSSLLKRFRSLSTDNPPRTRRSSSPTITLFRTKSILPSINEDELKSSTTTTTQSQLSCTIVDTCRTTANSCNVEELAAYLDNFLYLPKSLSGAAELMYT